MTLSRTTLLLSSFLLILAGCTISTKSKSIPDQCPDISGTYYDIADEAYTGCTTSTGPKQSQCRDVSGTYDNIVDEAYSYSLKQEPNLISCERERDSGTVAHRCTLNAWLNPEHSWIAGGVEACPNKTIIINQPDSESIDVIVKQNGSVTNQFRLSSKWDQFSCKNGTIILESLGIKSRWGHAGPPKSYTLKGEKPEKRFILQPWTRTGYHRLWGDQRLYKLEDGSLILKNPWHGLLYSSRFDWYKWQRVSDNNVPSIICPK